MVITCIKGFCTHQLGIIHEGMGSDRFHSPWTRKTLVQVLLDNCCEGHLAFSNIVNIFKCNQFQIVGVSG